MSARKPLTVERNSRQFVQSDIEVPGGIIEITPPIDEAYWMLRVPLGDNAIVTFPKFGTFGIGFQKEEDWNTNLPYTIPAEGIWAHIGHNRLDPKITKKRGVEAIRLLQATLREMLGKAAQPETENFYKDSNGARRKARPRRVAK